MSTVTTMRESAVLTGRTFAHWRASPGPFLVNLLFPVLVLLMMGGLLGGAISGSVGEYFQFAVPGVLAVAMLFGIEPTMMAITTDAAATITDRLRSLPIASASVLAGRCAADMSASVLGLGVTMAAGFALGWRPDGGLAAAAGAVALLLWFRFALLWLGVFIGLKAKGPEVVTAAQILVWPVSLLSTVFIDPATMPGWLGAVAAWNPLSATATAVRELFSTTAVSAGTWPSEHALLLAIIFPAVITAALAPAAARTYRTLNR